MGVLGVCVILGCVLLRRAKKMPIKTCCCIERDLYCMRTYLTGLLLVAQFATLGPEGSLYVAAGLSNPEAPIAVDWTVTPPLRVY